MGRVTLNLPAVPSRKPTHAVALRPIVTEAMSSLPRCCSSMDVTRSSALPSPADSPPIFRVYGMQAQMLRGSKYTLNINAEMNYWPAEVTNLSGTHQPLFDMITDLSKTGVVTAFRAIRRKRMGAHHNTDIWRACGPADAAAWGMWPNGGVRCRYPLVAALPLYRRQGVLEEVLSHNEGLCRFLHEQYGGASPSRMARYRPSTSPEHGYSSDGSTIIAGCTMDNQIAFDAMNNVMLAAEVLGVDAAYRDSLRRTIDRLPPMQVRAVTDSAEWLVDADNPRDEHRHVSHLYGLYPSNQISLYANPRSSRRLT